jgi:hypothetical protein
VFLPIPASQAALLLPLAATSLGLWPRSNAWAAPPVQQQTIAVVATESIDARCARWLLGACPLESTC